MGAYLETTREGKHEAEPAHASPLTAPSVADIKAALDEILASQTFRVARAQRNFLRYVVEETLAGRGDLIKEYSIGVEVFGRGKSFDPRANNIVRAEANRLRSKLAKYYETEGRLSPVRIDLPKGGYAPIFLPAPLEPGVPNRAPVEPDAVQAISPALRWKPAVLLVAILIVICSTAALLWRARLRTARSLETPSIVVLPFRNLSDNKENEFFSDGLTDELIDGLGRVPRLDVVARTSAFQFKGKTLDVRQIGQKLNVRNVLEGTVRRYGDRLRITAQLDDAVSGYRLWSES
jgi:adenylate cyclase